MESSQLHVSLSTIGKQPLLSSDTRPNKSEQYKS
jgi:hypothetical protein